MNYYIFLNLSTTYRTNTNKNPEKKEAYQSAPIILHITTLFSSILTHYISYTDLHRPDLSTKSHIHDNVDTAHIHISPDSSLSQTD